MSDPDAYRAKARESLASAKADLDGKRYNSATSRAYYAAFQAAVSILLDHGIESPRGTWEHRFVLSQFSGRLVRRKKAVPAEYRGVLGRLLEARLVADYREVPVSRRLAMRAINEAATLVTLSEKKMDTE